MGHLAELIERWRDRYQQRYPHAVRVWRRPTNGQVIWVDLYDPTGDCTDWGFNRRAKFGEIRGIVPEQYRYPTEAQARAKFQAFIERI